MAAHQAPRAAPPHAVRQLRRAAETASDVVEDRLHRAARGADGTDGDERDQRDEQCVLQQVLAFLFTHERLDERHELRH